MSTGPVGLQLEIEQARRRLDDARRSRDRAAAARARRAVPAPVRVLGTAILTALVALPPLVVFVAYETARAFPCTTYARVKVTALWALAMWGATAIGWMWLRRRRPIKG
jgi:hypothetical protein